MGTNQPTEIHGNLSTAEMGEMFFDDIQTSKPAPERIHSEPKEKLPSEKAEELDQAEEEIKEQEEEAREDSEEVEEEAEEKPKKAAKKFKVGDEEIELSIDAVVPHKVDGKEVEVTVEELLNNYAGKQAWDTKFNELELQRRSFSKDKAQVQDLVTRFYDKANSNDPLGAIAVVAEASGVDPAKFLREFRGNIFKMIQEHGKKDAQELKLLEYQENEKTYEQIAKDRAERQTHTQKQAKINAEVQKVVDSTGATREQLYTIYEELKNQGHNDLTPERLGYEYVTRQRESKVVGILQSVDPNLDNETFKKVGSYLYKQAELNPDFSDSDLQDIANTLLDAGKTQHKQAKKKRLGEKLKKTAPERVVKKESRPSGNEPMFFDDL